MNDAQPLQRQLETAADKLDLAAGIRLRGYVQQVGDGVAQVVGLGDVGYEELLRFDSGALGMAYDLAETSTGVILLSGTELVRQGEGVRGEHRLPDIPVGKSALGRIIDPLGNALDEGPRLSSHSSRPLFQPAPEIVDRRSVDQSLWTGVMAIDAAISIGRGQRELIIGDRNVGKTSLAIDIVAAQKPGDVACVYVIVGQPMSRVISLRTTLEKAGCLGNTAIITADASSTPGMQYLAPYAGASLAESFRESGQHALVVYDDLTKHADAYREIALLLGRPPGREAFPGDIFYIHAELLERACAVCEQKGGGSVTALPLIETTDGDISSYIPTNLISITDGQIYLDSVRFERNQRPAIDVGRSVSRIGSVAQSPGMRKAAKNLKILLSRCESLESLSRMGLEMDLGMQHTLERGRQLRELLRQGRLQPRDQLEQIIALTAIMKDWLTDVPLKDTKRFIEQLSAMVRSEREGLADTISSEKSSEHDWMPMASAVADRIRPSYRKDNGQ
ncbi:F0F1 ATP synthase subunit alpha [Blastopirellula marina]|uniref:ATP synthase subunit alpha n=1 Tax=Blastopirellula marina TaxID=124 RepID=A0A2S8F0F5_9BACT|nr:MULTISPECIES: F0F1 ATP synthase subunit alpha [Pirellulaceae]PQO25620.1 F0F1 ATP synthase subunit alpha [Blastopirellula marina]RCS43303.1 F0F1 ATP synthase subunit alpha [Bremerella cremea]